MLTGDARGLLHGEYREYLQVADRAVAGGQRQQSVERLRAAGLGSWPNRSQAGKDGIGDQFDGAGGAHGSRYPEKFRQRAQRLIGLSL